MKKTFDWFGSMGKEYLFHNYKTENISSEKLGTWIKKVPLNILVNTKGTTFKTLTDQEKLEVLHPQKCIALIQRNPSILKRPIIEMNQKVVVGFMPEEWKQTL